MPALSKKETSWRIHRVHAVAVMMMALIALTMAPVIRAAEALTHFDVPQEPLSQGLLALGSQAHLSIAAPRELVAGKNGRAVQGEFTTQAALRQLLEGSGLNFEFVGQSAVRIVSSTQATTGLEEIVVTATKRAVDLQNLPQAVTAITSQRLDDLNAQTFQDYFRDVPGLMMLTDNLGHLDFTIRGVSDFSVNIPQTSATIGQYIDEIPVTATGAQLDMRLVDIDHIEVLRGPQGTYYGASSLGGTIRTITKKPDLYNFSGSVEGRMSATEHSSGASDQESAMLNVPLIQGKLALRGNYFNAQDRGFIDLVNLADPSSKQITSTVKRGADTSRADGGRVMALFAPLDSLTMLAEAIHTKTLTGRDSGYDPTVGDLLASVACASPGTPPPGPVAPPGGPCFNSGLKQSADLYNLTVNVDLGWASVVSASSWASTYRNHSNTPLQSGSLAPAGDVTNGSAFTQELRLVSSPSWSDRWDYVVGTFGSRRHTNDVGLITEGTSSVPIDQTSREAALFGEAGYKFDDHWNARLGARTMELRQKQVVTTTTPQGINSTERNNTFTPFTERAVLNYIFNSDAMVYGSVSSGFRQGGSNLPSPFPGVTVPASYDPDKTTNYEFGWKFSFPTLKATLNGAVYHIDWKNMQSAGMLISAGAAPLSYYRNVGGAVVDGFELESGLELARGLRVQASFSYIDARLAEDYVFSKVPLILHGLKGDKIPFVAPVSGSLSLNYRHPLGWAGLNGFGILNGQYQGKRTTDFNKQLDNPRFPTYAVMDPYWTTQAQLGIENDQWRIALYADNLFDSRAELYRGPPGPGGHIVELTDRPRTVGLSLRYNFK
jgi:outer membrane receptor protein involved in Fe transport